MKIDNEFFMFDLIRVIKRGFVNFIELEME